MATDNRTQRVFCLAFVLAMTNATAAFENGGLLFYSPFEQTVSPLIHSGQTHTPADSHNITFAKGILGSGVRVGDVGSLLRYPALGNIDPKAGSLSLWIRIGWVHKAVKNLNHSFVNIPGKLDCSHQWWGVHYFLWLANGNRGLGSYPGVTYKTNEDGSYKWLHEVFTWDAEGNFVNYHDGKPGLSVTAGPDLGRGLTAEDFFYIADPSLTVGDHNRMEMDELMIFDRPLSPAEVRTLYRRPKAKTLQTIATIPVQRARIAIDGLFNASQWANSLETTDFIDALFGDLCEDGLKLNMTSDAEGVYLSLRDHEQMGDLKEDSWDILIKPIGNSPARNFNCSLSEQSGLNTQSQHDWKVAVALADDKAYCLEAFIPWKSIGFDGDAQNREFEVNIIRTYSGERTFRLCWADIKKENPYVRIWPSTDLGRLSISRLNGLSECNLDFAASIEGKSQAAITQLYIQPSNREEYYDPDTMPGTKSYTGKQLKIEEHFADGEVSIKRSFVDTDLNSVIVKITDIDGDTIYQTQKQFTPAPPLSLKWELLPGQRQVTVTSFVSDEYLKIDDLQGVIGMYDSKGDLLEKSRMGQFVNNHNTLIFSMEKLPKGTIEIVGTLFDKNNEIFRNTTSFVMQDPDPDWITNPVGIKRRVTNVFSPIRLENRNGDMKISLWGREYRFNKTLFPSGVVSQGRQILLSPVNLNIIAQGKQLPVGPVILEETKSTESEVCFIANQKIGPYQVMAKYRIEFDGTVWTTMKISPLQQGSNADRIYLEFPFVSKHASFIHANNCAVSAPQFSAATPEKWSSGFKPIVWLGTEAVGKCFFMETPVGCRLAEKNRFYEVHRGDKGTKFRVNVVDHQIAFEEPIEISFGWFATPGRPLPENWLAWEYGSLPGVNYDVLDMTRLESDPYWDESNQFLHEAYPWEFWRTFSKNAKESGVVALKYTQTRFLSFYKDHDKAFLDGKKAQCKEYDVQFCETPERKFWANEWKSAPPQDYLCTNTTWRDLVCAGLKDRVEKGGINGIYFDYAFPMKCSRLLHGCNQRYDILSQREIRRRLTNIFEANGKPAIIMEHVSDNMLGPQMNFATCLLDGEQLSGGVENGDYREALPLDRMRVMSTGTNFGVIPSIIFYGGREKAKEAESFMAIWALHMPIHNISCKYGYPMNLWWAYMLDFEFNFDKDTKRLGYWENHEIVNVSPDNVKVTIYYKPSKMFVVASNLSDSEAKSSIQLDVKALGMAPGKLKVLNYVQKSNDAPKLINGTLVTPIRANSSVMCIVGE